MIDCSKCSIDLCTTCAWTGDNSGINACAVCIVSICMECCQKNGDMNFCTKCGEWMCTVSCAEIHDNQCECECASDDNEDSLGLFASDSSSLHGSDV